jgi:D-glycerate 3-kinase
MLFSMASRCPIGSFEVPATGGGQAVDLVERYVAHLAAEWRRRQRGPLIVGICGSQGSGKSTVSAAVSTRLEQAGYRVAVLSLDDLYLAREARDALGRDIHPLLRTRGVPGTHDVALGERVLDALANSGRTAIPRFDKAHDAPDPETGWPVMEGPVGVILFEGWCVGAAPEEPGALDRPLNALEREEDPAGTWRRFVNEALAGAYQRLFARLDRLILLAAPDFGVVASWRRQQEHELRARLAAERRGLEQTMDDAAVERFVRHYERLTRHILTEMPARADLLIRLDRDRRVRG